MENRELEYRRKIRKAKRALESAKTEYERTKAEEALNFILLEEELTRENV